jgi:hypothetical protein
MQYMFHEPRNSADLKMIDAIEQHVFGAEKRILLPPLDVPPGASCFRLIARTLDGAPVGSVCVLETGRPPVRVADFAGDGGRSARYTRLAVLPPFRGQNMSIRLILEAQRMFVAPNNFRRTWLLLPQDRAEKSLIAALLGFQCAPPVIRAEYGSCRMLYRDELSITSLAGNRRAWAFLAALAAPVSADVDVTVPKIPFAAMPALAWTLPPAA